MGNEILENVTDATMDGQEEVSVLENTIGYEQNEQPRKEKQKMKRSTKRMIFYWAFMIFPIAQMCMMYLYVNFSSFVLAFQVYEQPVGGMVTWKYSFESFKGGWNTLCNNMYLIKNSSLNYLINVATGLGLGTLFSFYVYKEYPLSNFFKVILFLPSLISGVILALIYRYMMVDVYEVVVKALGGNPIIGGPMGQDETRYACLVIYNVWVGFGSHVILLTGSMSGINDSLVEAAELDGINSIKEFWYITLPMIWPTIITFTITGMAGFFVSDMGAYAMFGSSAEGDATINTFGLRFFIETRDGELYRNLQNTHRMTYPEIAALGLIFTVITFTVMTTVKKLMEKFGPRVD